MNPFHRDVPVSDALWSYMPGIHRSSSLAYGLSLPRIEAYNPPSLCDRRWRTHEYTVLVSTKKRGEHVYKRRLVP